MHDLDRRAAHLQLALIAEMRQRLRFPIGHYFAMPKPVARCVFGIFSGEAGRSGVGVNCRAGATQAYCGGAAAQKGIKEFALNAVGREP